MILTPASPEAPQNDPQSGPTALKEPRVILPSHQSIPAIRATTPLTPVVCDERAIAGLLGMILNRAGLSVGEAAKRMGVSDEALRQYLKGRRTKPSLIWFVKLAELCGARVLIELPGSKGGF